MADPRHVGNEYAWFHLEYLDTYEIVTLQRRQTLSQVLRFHLRVIKCEGPGLMMLSPTSCGLLVPLLHCITFAWMAMGVAGVPWCLQRLGGLW